MTPYERFKLYEWVKEIKPKTIFEAGTGAGVSTMYMAHALTDIGNGKLLTCDPKSETVPPDLIKQYSFIDFFPLTSSVVIDCIIKEKINIDFIFFDGPDDPEVAIDDIKKFEPAIKPGTYFSMHDWETVKRPHDGQTSTKALYIREYIEKSENWESVEVLSGLEYTEGQESVGMCLYLYNNERQP